MPAARLLIALGNPLAGDDGVAWHLARRLRADPRLPPDVEVLDGGTDLLRLADELPGRARVILLDALLEAGPPGRLVRFDGDLHELESRGVSVHHLPPVQALRLLRSVDPEIRTTPVTFIGITVPSVRVSETLSPALEDRLPYLAAAILALLRAGDQPSQDSMASASTSADSGATRR